MAKVKGFCRCKKDLKWVDFELAKREYILGWPDFGESPYKKDWVLLSESLSFLP